MKIGVSYNLFDGEELLQKSIEQIRKSVDYISVVYQKISNHGEECSPNLVEELEKLKTDGLIDTLYEYKPLNALGPHGNEIAKRNIGLELSRGENCTHHMSMDTDEFYVKEEFDGMKKFINDGDYDSCACQMTTYYKLPTQRLEPKEEYYVSLLFKIRPGVNFEFGYPFPVLVDPTRRMNSGKSVIFTRNEIEMHHMSYVRKDIMKKVNNSSAKVNFGDSINDFIKFFNNWKKGDDALMLGLPPKKYKLVEVENIFGI